VSDGSWAGSGGTDRAADPAPPVNSDLTVNADGLRVTLSNGMQLVVPLYWMIKYGLDKVGSGGIWLKVASDFNDRIGSYKLTFEGTFEPEAGQEIFLDQVETFVGSRIRSSLHRDAEARESGAEPRQPDAASRESDAEVREARETRETRDGESQAAGSGSDGPDEAVQVPVGSRVRQSESFRPVEDARTRHADGGAPGRHAAAPISEKAEPPPPPPPIKGPDLAEVLDDFLLSWPLDDTVALSRGELIEPPERV